MVQLLKFFLIFSKKYPPTFQVGTEIMRFGMIFINFFKYFPLSSLWGRISSFLPMILGKFFIIIKNTQNKNTLIS